MYPSNGTYQVRTLVNGSFLEDCSIIRFEDEISPSFANSVADDPDLTGLLVYLLDSQGEIAGKKIRYVLQSYADTMEIEENTEVVAEETEETEETDEEDEQTVKTEPKETEIIIVIESFDQELPHFSLPEDLEPGSYNLIFEVLGGKEILSRTEAGMYYLGSIGFHLKDISLYLPSLSGSQLIPPGTMVMLEAGLDFDSYLDPYVIWYQGKNIVGEGRISDGAGTLLWKAPEHADFYSLRVEAFPVYLEGGLTGISREIALPVSPRAANADYFFDNGPQYAAKSPLSAGVSYPEWVDHHNDPEKNIPAPPQLLRWYQFNGNLLDSTAILTDNRPLIPANEAILRWAAAGQSYGLSVGAENSYSLSPISFFQNEQDHGGGILLSHISPPAEGVILDVFFPLQSSEGEGAWITVTREENSIVLQLGTKEKTIEMPVELPALEAQSFIPIVVEFYIRPYRIEAKLSLGEDQSLQHKAESIGLSEALAGEGRIILGNNSEHISIWNEFAVLLSELPLLHGELLAMAAETDNSVYVPPPPPIHKEQIMTFILPQAH